MSALRAQRVRALRSDAIASRKALLVAARELIAERGPEALTIVAVARRAGLNRSTAYQHFASREALTQAVAEDFAAELSALFGEERLLGEKIDFFVHHLFEHPDIARLWMYHLLAGQSRHKAGWEQYVGELRELAERPDSRPGMDPEMLGIIGLSSALVWSVMARQQAHGEAQARADTRRFARELGRLFIAGIRDPGGAPESEPPGASSLQND